MNDRVSRRFSQAISEGDAISVLVEVSDSAAARAAEQQGADGVVVDGGADVRSATELPVLWRGARVDDALAAGADAWLLVLSQFGDGEERGEQHARARELGLDCVVEVRDEEELEDALEQLDPEIFLLAAPSDAVDGDALDHVLALLPDVPAGKLAIAHLSSAARGDVESLERAGMDAVLVAAQDVSSLVAAEPPEV